MRCFPPLASVAPGGSNPLGQLGLSDGWAQAPVQLYGRDRRSGTRAFFQEHVLAGGDFVPTLHEEPGAASVILI